MASYDVNYDDKRFTAVEADKNAALNEVDVTYGNMINSSDKYFDAQIQASKDWADKQSQLQQDKTDFAIEQVEQQKEQAKKDYTKEQAGAYVDWQKQSDPYGVNAEKMASGGLQNSGFAESSQVAMYNAYQNRVAMARESYNRAVLNYNNAIQEAKLQNNSILAEIAAEALQKQLELSLQGFQYKNTLVLEKSNKKLAVESEFYKRYQDVLAQINHENAMAEEIRQFNETKALQEAQLAEEKRQFNEQMAYTKSKSSGGGGGGGGGGYVSGGSDKDDNGGKVSHPSAVSNKYSEPIGPQKPANNNQPTVDQDSVLALGYGPISAARLAELENQGIIESYTSGGKIKFRKTSWVTKTFNVLTGR